MPLRLAAFFLLAVANGGAAQVPHQATDWVSAEWVPASEENERQYNQAADRFKAAVDAEMKRLKESGHDRPRGGTGSSPPGGEMGVPASRGTGSGRGGPLDKAMNGSSASGRGVGRGRSELPSPEQFLPAALDFAAPSTGALILQRMHSSILFGRTDSEAIVMISPSGETDLANGARAHVTDIGGEMLLTIVLPTGREVKYRYHKQSEASDRVMSVDVSVGTGFPGPDVEFQRLYRRAEVKVNGLKKDGG
jgi:hypothetical protein